MNFTQWFQSWYRDRRMETPPAPDHAARLSIRRLEERQVFSVGAILAGFDVTFTGDEGGASSDSLVFTIDGSGNLEHNLGGINGFHSNIDLDNLTAGDQSLTIGQIENLNILLGDDADSVQFGADFDFSSGNLSIEAESITAIGGSLTVQGTTTLDAGSANDITLDQANDFFSVTIVSAHDVTLNDTSDLLLEGELWTTGNLSVTASGSLSNSDGAIVTVMGHAHFEGSTISLGVAADEFLFGTLSFHSTGAVTIEEDSDTELAGDNTAHSLDLESIGAITDSSTSLNVSGLAEFTATAITLGGAGTDTNLDSLTFHSTGAVVVQEDSDTELAGDNTALSLDLESSGVITDTSTSLNVSGLAEFTANAITLGGTGTDTNFVSLSFHSTGVVVVQEDSATELAGDSTAQTLELESSGAITDSSTSLGVNGLAEFTANAITLGGAGTDTNVGSLTFHSTGAVAVQEDSDANLAGDNTALSLDLNSTGALTDNSTSLTVSGLAVFTANSITLGGAGTDTNVGSLTFHSTGAVVVQEDSDTELAGDNTALSLDLNSSGTLTDASTSLNVTSLAEFTANAITLGGAGADTNFGTIAFHSTGAVAVQEDSDTELAGDNSALSLNLNSTVTLTDASTSLNVTSLAEFTATAITLGGAGTDTNFGTLTFNSTGAVAIQEDSDTELEGDNTALTFNLESSGAITDTSTSLNVSDHAEFTATAITLGGAGTDTNFGSLTFHSTGAVVVQEDSGTELTGDNTALSLDLNSIGALTDSSASLNVSGLAEFTATAITLGGAGTDTNFGSLTFHSTGIVAVQEDSDTELAGDNSVLTLDMESSGVLTDSSTSLSVSGLAEFTATAITLGGTVADTNFGSLTFHSPGAVVVQEDSDTKLEGSNTALSLDLESSGVITDSSTSLNVNDLAEFTANSITLGGAGTGTNFGSLTFHSTGAVVVQEDSGTELAGDNSALSLDLNSSGALTDASTSLNVSGLAEFTANSITLGGTGTDTNFGSLAFHSPGAVVIQEDSDTELAGNNTALMLDLESAGTLTDTSTSLAVGGLAEFTANLITLGSAGTETNLGSLTFHTAGAVLVQEDSDTELSGDNTALTLYLNSSGALTDTSTSVSVSGLAEFTATTLTLGGTGIDTNFGSLSFLSPGVVTIQEDSGTELAGDNTALTLDLESTGALTDSSISLNVIGLAEFTSDSIALGGAGIDTNFGSLTFHSTGAMVVQEDSDTELAGDNTALTFNVESGAITDSSTSLNVIDLAEFTATAITLGGTGTSTNFGSLTLHSTGTVVVQEDSDTELAGDNTALTLDLESGGAITDSSTSLNVSGLAEFTATAITLGGTGIDTNFGLLAVHSPGAVVVQEDSDTEFAGDNSALTLVLESMGAITDSSTSLSVSGLAEFSGSSITLGGAGTDTNVGSLTFHSTGAVVVQEDSDTELAGDNSALALDLNSSGALTDASASLTVSDLAEFTAIAITVGGTGTSTNFGSLTFHSAGAVSVQEDSDTELAGDNSALSLDVVSAGAITDTSTSLNVSRLAQFTANTITLGGAGADTNFGSLTFHSTGAVVVQEDSDTELAGDGSALTLNVESAGALTDSSSSLNVIGLAEFTATAITLGGTGIDTNFGSLSFLSTGAVAIQEDSGTELAGDNSALTLNLNSTGDLTDASTSLNVTSLAEFTGNAITLGSAGAATNLGSLTFNSTGAVAVQEDSDTELAGDNTALTLDLNSTGAITDNSTRVTVSGLAEFTATTLTLGGAGADTNFGSLAFHSPGAVVVQEDSDTELVGDNSAQTLDLESSGALNDISTSLNVSGLAEFTATAITLGGTVTSTNFGSLTFHSTGAVVVQEDSDTELAGDNSALTLDVESAGALTDTSTRLSVSGLAEFTATAITLGGAGADTNFGSLSFHSTGAVAVQEDSDTELAGDNSALTLNVESTGAITDCSTSLNVSDHAEFTATAIMLGGNGTDTNFGSLAFHSFGVVVVQEDSDTELAGDNTALTLDLSSTGALTDTSTSLSVSGLAEFTGTAIYLGWAGTDTNFGTLTYNSTGAVVVQEDSDTELVGDNTALTLDLNSTGALTDTSTSLTVNGLAEFTGTAITLGGGGTDSNFGSLTFHSTGAVAVQEDSDTELAGDNSALTLNLGSSGAITDGSTSLNVSGLAEFTANAITLGGAGADTNFGTLTFNSTGAVSIQEDSDTELAGDNSSLSLDLNSSGALTDASTSLTVSGLAEFAANSITLGGAGSDTNFGTLTFHSTSAVVVQEDSDTELTGDNSSMSLDLVSAGTLTDASSALNVTGLAEFTASAITLGGAGTDTNFGSLTFHSTGAVVVQEDSDTELTGDNTASTLDLNSTGALTDASTSLNVSGLAEFTANSIALGGAGTDTHFGSLTFHSTGAVQVQEDSDTQLSGVNTALMLDLNSTGALTDTSTSLNVNGLAEFTATAITLGGAGTDTNFGSLTFHSPGAVVVQEDSDTELAGDNTALTLDLESAGAITDGSTSLNVSGLAEFTATAITLGGGGTDTNFGSLTLHSIGAVTIQEDSDTVISGPSSSGNLQLASAGDLSLNASVDVSGDANLSASGSISLAAPLSVTGLLALEAGDDVSVNSDLEALAVQLSANDDISIQAAIDATNSIELLAGRDGSGSVTISAAGSLVADNSANTADIVLSTGSSSGAVTLTGTLTADDQVTITAADAINGAGLVTAREVDLDAGSGIGNTTALDLAVSVIAADSIQGDVELHNSLAADYSSVTTGTGTIVVENLGPANFDTVTTTDGAIALTVDGDLTIQSQVSAGGNDADDDLTLTTTSGQVILTGTTTAVGNDILITSAASISGPGLVTGEGITLSSQTGIDTQLSGSMIEAAAVAGDVVLTNVSTSSSQVQLDTGAGNASVTSAAGVAMSGTVNGHLAVTTTTGDITSTSPLTVTGTSEFSTLQSGADIDLQNLAASSSVTVQTVGPEGDVSIGSTANLQLQGTVNGHLVANVTGDLTDSGTLHVTRNTTITATGDVIWDESASDFVGAVSVAAQAVQIHDANAILLGDFDATSITITAGGTITLGTGSGEQVTATGTVSLTSSSGGVSEATGTEIQASALLLQGTGPFALNEVNQIGTLAAEITGPLSLANATDLTIGTVNGISGVSTAGHDVKLSNQGDLTIEQAITLGVGDLFLDVDGDAAQAGAGTINASGLALMVDGTSTFGLDNDVDRLAADVGGTLVFHDIDGLTIGSVAEEASPSLMALQGITSSDDAVTVTTSTGDLILERAVHLSTGDLTLEATTGRILDGLDGQTLLTARNLSLTAASHIGEITDFATGTGNAIDVALSGQLTSASINATNGQIFVIGQGDLTAATGSVNVGGANAASAILRSVGGNLDVGTAPGVFTLSTGDHLRLEAIKVGNSGGTLVLPDAGLNVGTGDLWLQGDADIVNAAGRQLGPLVADDLRFISGGSGGNTTVETQINTLTATITGAGSALTINEADGLTLVDIETTDGDFTVHASQGSAGNITVGNITAGQARVTLATVNHGGGQIIDGDSVDNPLSADISASAVDLQASTGIANNTTLEVEAEQLAAITSSGDINVRDLSGDLAIATLAGGTAGVTISDGISGDNIAIATVGALDVEAAVLNEGAGTREILLAADGATTTNDLTLQADVTGRGGDVSVTLLAGDTISLSGTTTVAADGAGSVRVAAGRVLNHGGVEGAGTTTGHLLMADGSVIQSAGGDIHLAAPGDVQLSVVNAGDGPGGGDLFITADADQSGTGAITEVLSGESSNLIADRVTLLAATGIGSGGATADIDTSVETLVATNTHSGSLQIHETDSLTIAGSGVRTLNGSGAVRVQVTTGELVVDSPVTAHGAGPVTLLADQGPVIINADVRSTTGAITIGGHEVLQNAMLATGGTGSVVVTAEAGSITMSDGASTETSSGEIRYAATNDVALSLLRSTTGDLFITADSDGSGVGAITDNTASEAPLLVTSGTATLSAATGIGDGQAIDTAIGELTATNSTSGDIQIREVDDLVIVGPGVSTSGGSGNIAIDVQQGDLVVDGAVTAHDNGNITIDVDQGGLSLNAEVTSTTGDIGLTADQVQQNLGGNIRTGSGPNSAGAVSVIADNGSLTMADGTTTTTSTGTIQYEATGQVALSQLISTSGDLVVSAGRGASTVGAITDNTASESPNLVTTGRATLIAETGIGSTGGSFDIDTSVAELSLTNSTSGNIVLTEANAVTVVHLSQAGGGDASLQTANGTLTVDNGDASPQAITVADGGRLILAASGSQSDLIVNDGVQARGGDITLLASRDVTANSAPITSTQGNGDITVQAGRDIKILDAGNRNPVDMAVAGSGIVRLNAANQLVLGSQNPTTASNQTQHTVPNDVLIQTQTGSITNTLPLAYDLQSPQITGLGEAELSITIGRPGDTNLTVRIFWGDGSVRTVTGLSHGTHTFSYAYQGNPDAFNPSAPILINVQVAHDPQIVMRAPNLNSPVGFIVNSAVDVPPPIPAQNINADLASALFDSTNPLFGTLQSQVVTRPGTEAAPGAVVFQDTTVRATLVPVPGDGLASFVFDTTPPVVHLTFPEAPKIIDTQSSSGVQLSEGTLNQNDAARADESLSEERVVVLEILSPDGTVQQKVILPESTLDQMHEVIGKLPDGAYRFLLREPGEDRMRLLLEFDVRQGKISNETEADDRPPSSAPKVPSDTAVPVDPADPAPAPMDDSDAVLGDTTAVETLVDVDQDQAVSPPQRSGWSSVAARRAWQRGAEPLPDETSAPSATTDDTVNNEPSEAAWAGCTVAVIGAGVTIGTRTPASRGRVQPPLARLNRGAQLLRKFAPFEK